MKKHDANDDRANGADTGPHGIGCAQGKRLCGTGQQPHAQEGECQKTTHPFPAFQSTDGTGAPQAISETNFTQSCNYQDQPVHSMKKVLRLLEGCKTISASPS